MSRGRRTLLVLAGLAALLGCTPTTGGPPPSVQDETAASKGRVGGLPSPDLDSYGRMIYVPAYSHIYHVQHDRDFQLTVTLSVRNPFPWRSLTISRVDYFDSSGAYVRS